MTHLLALWAALAWAGCGEVCEKDARPACRACVLEAAKAGEEPPAEAVLQTSLRGMDKPELSVLLKLHRDKASEIEKETREDAPAARQAAIAALERRLEELDAAEEPGDLSD
ncbi:MAG: hypothetical protein HY925_01270, partial [Elusimicrobia bacterium]|nr:hypothetical protein [Elusimicrobiota bacterium]